MKRRNVTVIFKPITPSDFILLFILLHLYRNFRNVIRHLLNVINISVKKLFRLTVWSVSKKYFIK